MEVRVGERVCKHYKGEILRVGTITKVLSKYGDIEVTWDDGKVTCEWAGDLTTPEVARKVKEDIERARRQNIDMLISQARGETIEDESWME